MEVPFEVRCQAVFASQHMDLKELCLRKTKRILRNNYPLAP